MNKFTTLSTRNYLPLSYQDQYFYNKYDLIRTFLEDNFGEDFSELLAFPILKRYEVDWLARTENRLKRVSEFSKSEQDKILNIYWEKINKINVLTTSFLNSNSSEKKEWANLLNDVFNSENNIVFSDGELVVVLWGWKFNNSGENYIPLPSNPSPSNPPPPNPSPNHVSSFSTPPPSPPPSPVEEDIFPPKHLPWYILFWQWLRAIFRRFWWLLLLFLILWILLNLDGCSCNKSNDIDLSPYNPPDSDVNVIYDNDPNNDQNTWDIDDNNTGLEDDEYLQVIENNHSPDIYEDLLTDEEGNERLLPNKPRVNIPINHDSLIFDKDNNQYIVPDRINVVLKDKGDKIIDFANDFKEAFPESKYQIIYRDDNTRRMQIRVPEQEREVMKDRIRNSLNSYDLLIWDETIFGRSSFNDPGLGDDDINWFLENINVYKAWEMTTGKKEIVIAIIDDGFDLSHEELNNNIIKPWNVLNQNSKVYANDRITHGTHVSGIAIAENNNNKGLCGIAPSCSFMPIQMGNDQPGFSSTAIIDGILYAINNGADIINLSIHIDFSQNGTVDITPLRNITQNELNSEINHSKRDAEFFWNEIFEMAEEENIMIVFAAGNCDVLIGLDQMKRADDVIIVSAVDKYNKKAIFSNHGERSTVSAPGVDIFSSMPGNRYACMDGTSQAAPIISGVVGLMKSINPNLSNKDVISILQKSGKNIDNSIGPLIDVKEALDLCGGSDVLQNKSINADSIRNEIKMLEDKINELEQLLD